MSQKLQCEFDHGLSDSQLQTIKSILREYASKVESVSLFGSRASGAYKSNSDIDLVLYGDIDSGSIDRLWTLFNESNVPYKVDLSAYQLITYPPLKRHIDSKSKVLFTRAQLEKNDEVG